MSDYTWVTEPPIRKLTETEAEEARKTIQANMQGWVEVDVPDKPNPPYPPAKRGQSKDEVRLSRPPTDIDMNDWKQKKRTFQERWNDRISSTNNMLEGSYTGTVFGYFVTGVPVALIALLESTPPIYVADLVCHPGSENGGTIMIEFAVNRAMKKHKDPRITLWALDDEALVFYQKLGFDSPTKDKPKDMILDPRTKSEIWKLVDTTWCISKYANLTHYLS